MELPGFPHSFCWFCTPHPDPSIWEKRQEAMLKQVAGEVTSRTSKNENVYHA